MRALLGFLLVGLLITAPGAAAARPGDLDRSFGTNVGFTEFGFNSTESFGTALAIRRDRSIVAVGTTRALAGDDRFAVALLNRHGRKPRFRTIGFSPGAPYGSARGVGVQRSGRIVIGGEGRDAIGAGYVALTRLTALGRLDLTFGDSGRVLLPIGTAGVDDVTVDPRDRVVASGAVTGGMFLRRFLRDGLPDASFGDGGVVTVSGVPAASAVTVDRRGRLVIGGVDRVTREFVLMRFTATGARDATFGAEGIVRLPSQSTTEPNMGDVLALPDGYAVSGAGRAGNRYAFLIGKVTLGGRSARFGTRGVVRIGKEVFYAGSLVRQRNGRIIAVGGSGLRTAVARLRASGRRDRTFGTRGFRSRTYGRDDGTSSTAGAIQSGRLVLVGTDSLDERIDYSSHMVVARWRL